MIEMSIKYFCTDCGDKFHLENIEYCKNPQCAELVCPDCDGEYCDTCKDFEELEVDKE